ncbi:hypothetical protein [Leisingera caerulea]|uniref:hypothetical protein n=1 Tax=Leisingera caerulea TaxID=506591 RepID=UPI0012B5BFB4|nr:hypothetical protein [Leisingera caerulea]
MPDSLISLGSSPERAPAVPQAGERDPPLQAFTNDRLKMTYDIEFAARLCQYAKNREAQPGQEDASDDFKP